MKGAIIISAIAAIVVFVVVGGIASTVRQEKERYERISHYIDSLESVIQGIRITVAEEKAEAERLKGARWNALISALIIVESDGIASAVGDKGEAVGVLQIHPCVVDDVRIAGHNYTLVDRYDREKSIEIWKAWQNIYNPEKDLWKAIKYHNPRLSTRECERIIRLSKSIYGE